MMRRMTWLAAMFVAGGLIASLYGADTATKPAPKAATTEPYQAMASPRTDEGAVKRHEEFLARGKAGPIGVLLIGDSITAGWGGSAAKKTWDKDMVPLNAANFGIGSDATQHVLWRITTGGELDAISPKVVVLLIGTNNINGEAKAVSFAVTKIVKIIHEKLPKSKILLLAIFPRAQAKDTPKTMENVKAVNADLAKLDDGKTIRFLDLANKLAPDGKVAPEVFSDGVHLTEKGYEIWGEGMLPLLKTMME